jgi:hypothetical protein
VLLPPLPKICQHFLAAALLGIGVADHTADLLQLVLFPLLQGGVVDA